MATTTGDNIFYRTSSTAAALEAESATQAGSIQVALNNRAQKNYRWANAIVKSAQTGMAINDTGYVVTENITYRYNGSVWDAWDSGWITSINAPTNLTVGTGGSATSVQRYKYISGKIYFDYTFVLGTTGASVGVAPSLNLPIYLMMRSGGVESLGMETGVIYDLSAASTVGYTKHLLLTSNTVRISYNTATTWAITNITATAPITFASGDVIAGAFWADPA